MKIQSLAVEEALASLHSSDSGLTADEAERRLPEYGANEVEPSRLSSPKRERGNTNPKRQRGTGGGYASLTLRVRVKRVNKTCRRPTNDLKKRALWTNGTRSR